MKKTDILNSLDESKYQTSLNLSAACRAFAIMVGGFAMTQVVSENEHYSTWLMSILLALLIYFLSEVLQYLIPLIKISRLYKLYELDSISKEELENKNARLQNVTSIFLYIKLTALLVSIVFLVLNVI
ncbi:hypothetical protein [Parabacteroides pacaensis]|uniref:hypothetical protein n=1 Tax=Parabacteroides pacaensis TaxID=2086575 RepID=UPI000D114715|nr:hypothetical protein [Parabacteroides pacaensis]